MRPDPDPQARRLFVSAAISARNARRLGRGVPTGATGEELLGLARLLGVDAEELERAHRLCFDPPYPGSTPGVENTRAGPRLVLACMVSGREQGAFGVVFTTLIPGRPSLVSVAPVEARIPAEWRPVGGLPDDAHSRSGTLDHGPRSP